MEAPSLIALAVARLDGETLVLRLAALARRGRDGTLPDRVRAICDAAQVGELAEPVRREAFRQERVAATRVPPRPWRPATSALDERRWRVVRRVLGSPEVWAGQYADYTEAAITKELVLALARTGWASDPPKRGALVFRPGVLRVEAIRVPGTLLRLADTLAWLVHEDLPATASGEAFSQWLRGRPRLRSFVRP